MACFVVAGTSAVGLVLLGAMEARAAVVIDFLPPSAPPGTVVSVTAKGAGPAEVSGDNLALYLAPSQRVADAVSGPGPPKHPLLEPFGRLSLGSADEATGRIRVPNVAPGRYVTVVYCEGCDAHEDGTSFSAIGRFRVVRGSALPETGSSQGIFILFVGSLCTSGIALLAWSAARKRSHRRLENSTLSRLAS